MDDPNSLQSQKAREAVKSFFGDVRLPAGFDNWSASDVQKFASTGALAQVQRTRNAAEDDARKVAAAGEKAAAEQASLDNSRKAFAADLKKRGIDPQHASQKDIDRVLEDLRADRAGDRSDAMLAIALAGRKDKEDDRKALGEGIPFAGGELKYSGSGPPREEDKKEAIKIAASWNAALSGMDQLEKSLAAYAASPGASTKRDVDSKVRVVSSALNSAVGGGAMSQDEATAMSQALGADLLSPTGVEAVLRGLMGDDPGAAAALTTRLRSVRESAKATALGKLQSYRFGMGGASGGGKVRVSNGKETLLIDPADLADAERDGFKRAD